MRRLLVALVLTAAACSNSDPSTVATQAPVTTDPTPTVDATTPPPTVAPVPTTAAPVATTAAPVRKAVDGDVDGDGQPDAVKATSSTLVVTLSRTGTKVSAPVHADSPAAPEVLGSTDVDRDGHAEVFLKTVQGASTGFTTPYRYDGKVLHELQLDGAPAVLGFGGSAQHGDGFRCTPAGRIEVRKAELDASGSSYTIELSVYRLTATALVRVSQATSTAKQGSPEVQASYAADCGSVGEGG